MSRAIFLALAVVVLACPSEARVVTLLWTHPEPWRCAGFRAHVGAQSRVYEPGVDIGLPQRDANGVWSYGFDFAEGAIHYVAITAYDRDGLESDYSNERVIDLRATTPTDPLYSQSFESTAIGGLPPDWYSSTVGNSMAPAQPPLHSVVSLSGNRVLSTSSTADPHAHYRGPGSETWSGYEYAGRLMAGHADAGIGITAYSDYPATDTYYRLRRYAEPGRRTFHVAAHPWQAKTVDCPQADSGVDLVPAQWLRFRWQLGPEAAGTRLRAKFWADGTPEPEPWQIDCLDAKSDRLARGRVGVWSWAAGAKHWDDLTVTPLTGAPPTPEPPPVDVPPLPDPEPEPEPEPCPECEVCAEPEPCPPAEPCPDPEPCPECPDVPPPAPIDPLAESASRAAEALVELLDAIEARRGMSP